MTTNKAQSQTLDYVGLYLPQQVFSHGQLYVGLSRVGSADRIKVFSPFNPASCELEARGGTFTRNIVYREVLRK